MNALVTVRPGDADDRDFVRDLGRRSATTSISSVRDARYDDVLFAFERLMEFAWGRRHVTLIAHENGARLGFLLMLFDIPDEVTLTDQGFVAYMAVEPHARNCGVGRALLEAAEAHARDAGRAYISLMVTEDNLPARALYDGAGFATERRMLTKRL